jgi:hypothetical protein
MKILGTRKSRPAHGSYYYIMAAKDDLTGITEACALQSIGSEALANFF